MPSPPVWGPSLWKLLHGVGALRFPENTLLRKDAERELLWLFGHIESIVYCEECKGHIKVYKKSHPLPSVEVLSPWFYEFHEAVNQRLGKPGGPPFTQSLGLLSGQDLRTTWKEYKIKCGGKGQELKDYERHLLLCLGFFGV